MRVNQIRNTFLDYFKRLDHQVVPSSSLVPHDPTLMFTAAGMVQFKNVFTGLEQRPYSRATTSQKCVRAGGKHNDLENVGYTARHHTFFEMLGNFSFGDYFKEQAIDLAWNLIVNQFGIEKNKLVVTVYHDDDEAYALWKKIAGFPDDRILRIATSDNFWSMGATGPCGPCSEIFYDHGDHIPGGLPGTPEQDGDRFVEIWNLVFMQYDQQQNGSRVNLPRPSIDTGMGLERLAAVLQGVHDNYDIDLFKQLINASEEISGVKAEGQFKFSHRVIADHLRSSSFLIADGVMPSNEGRGYVLRRILRRALRHVHCLEQRDPMMYKLVKVLVAEMGEAYPELCQSQALIEETIKQEEERFQTTLDRGLKLLKQESSKLTSSQKLSGEVAFKLCDTFGFPLDLTQDILRQESKDVDLESFNQAMAQQKSAARASWVGSGDVSDERIWFDVANQYGSTDFMGYDQTSCEGAIEALIKNDVSVAEIKAGDCAQVVVNQTPFYAESGGQMGDAGSIINADLAVFKVSDTQKKQGQVFSHVGSMQEGSLKVGDVVHLDVDHVRRNNLRAHHSATHLLHAALRQKFGPSVMQKGSLVAADKLRFDYSFNRPLSQEDVYDIEDVVNKKIRQNALVNVQLMSAQKATQSGAMALFGEKYSDEVRVVSMGHDKLDDPFSKELCGGTHVSRTGDIGCFRIVGESGVAAGIRRIEAVVGQSAELFIRNREEILLTASSCLKVNSAQLIDKIHKTLLDQKDLQNQIKKIKTSSADVAITKDVVNGMEYIYKHFEDMDVKSLKAMADQLKAQIATGVVLITAQDLESKKVSIVAAVTNDVAERYDAVKIVQIASKHMGGAGGGGRSTMAQGGGSDVGNLSQAQAAVKEFLSF